LEQGKHEYKEAADAIQGKLRTEEGKSLFGAIERIHEQYVGLLDQEVSLQRAQNTKGALEILTNQSAPLSRELEKAIETFISHEHQAKKQIMDEQSATESKAETLVLTLAVIGVLTGIGVALLIVRSITSAIGAMVNMIQEIADNNLRVADLEVKSQDEIGAAGVALNRMKSNLQEVVRSIAGTAEHVASASEEISSSATQQVKSSETQKGRNWNAGKWPRQ